MARKDKHQQAKYVDPDDIVQALARAVTEGDFVSFRTIFMPFSPARVESSESFDDEKYAYLLPDDAMMATPEYAEAQAMVRAPETWKHIEGELEARRLAQLPSNLLLMLGDNAVRHGKFTNASQAYELLRIRQRMQDEFFRQADEALDKGDIEAGVYGYRASTGLDYDYSAFPEPLPKIARFQSKALLLHGTYPPRPEDAIPMQPPETFLRTALSYLLDSPEGAARLENRPLDVQVSFLLELIRQSDPDWDVFRDRYREAIELARDFGERISRAYEQGQSQSLADEIEATLGEDPMTITSHLLGRVIEDGTWWQYLKELAYVHPASALFVARQMVGDTEILVPRPRPNSPVVQRLELLPAALIEGGG